MKRLFPLLLLPLLVMALHADPPEDVLRPYASPSSGYWFTQFDIGLNWSFLNGDPTMRSLIGGEADDSRNYLSSANGLAPIISASIGYAFNEMFGLRFQAAYDSRSASRSETTLDTCIFETFFTEELTDKEYSVRADYLTFSLLWDVDIDNFMIYAGPSVSLPLSMNIEESLTIGDPDSLCNYFLGELDQTHSISAQQEDKELLDTRFSFKLGVGYKTEVGTKTDVIFQLGYDFGLTDLLSDPAFLTFENPEFSDDPNRSMFSTIVNDMMDISSLQATVGIRFNL